MLLKLRYLYDVTLARRHEKGAKKSGFTLCKLLKIHVEKMSIFRLSTMLVKTNELKHSLHDVDEKKGNY